ncbi:peptidase M38 [Raphidocelis subcapitata]|uniref:Peptidase M38 n=1 Tax=Raphidocelis subcapitata TaxID=307507 RepID=A0A2V0PAP3_9CHLO|nr:peptidase M38 [Raphidocelis subcapitata]|eukprot:GBF96931.1 peptidase M38 [Raphidocelis subcapitata]
MEPRPVVASVAEGPQQPAALLRDSFAAAKRAGGGGSGTAPAPHPRLLLRACRVWDAAARAFTPPASVAVAGGRIAAVGEPGSEGALSEAGAAAVVDCGGLFLLPGLSDAHVHVTAVTADLAGLMSLPESLVTAVAAEILGGMLLRGFTAVRDAGGADWGLARAVEEGSILGPRILFTGHALSQTGGHGDFRGRGEDCCACGAALRGIGRVCDGVGECRRAARDELRRGAHCIKVMASGGVASPTDRLTSTQFSLEELRAIVEEAQAAGTYVCAHAYKPSAIKRAIECGVRSIEHGNWLDRDTAALMASRGAFLVPTLVTYDALRRGGVGAGMARELVDKVADAVEQGQAAVALARSMGVKMAFGSDLLGELHKHQSEEFRLRAEAGVPAAELIEAATSRCAELFGLEETHGAIAPGRAADLVLLDSDPLGSPAAAVLAASGAHVALVVKDGLVAAARGGEARMGAVNAALAGGGDGSAAGNRSL